MTSQLIFEVLPSMRLFINECNAWTFHTDLLWTILYSFCSLIGLKRSIQCPYRFAGHSFVTYYTTEYFENDCCGQCIVKNWLDNERYINDELRLFLVQGVLEAGQSNKWYMPGVWLDLFTDTPFFLDMITL